MSENPKFQEFKAKHPDWSDEQIWTAISLDMQTDKVIEEKGKDVDPEDPDIIEEIIKGAMEWLDEVLPYIFEKVKEFLYRLLTNIGDWIREGLNYLIEHINKFF